MAIILAATATRVVAAAPGYSFVANPHPDATGKVYLGREISHVMGHQAADWLERPERSREENPLRLLQLLAIKPGDVVADIGAGSGFHTRRLAAAVGAEGRVMAVDIQPEMLQILQKRLRRAKITNVETVLGKIDDAQLPPDSIDLAVMVDVYHEFSHPFEMIDSIVQALKPGGRIVFVEYRAEDANVPIKPHHKMTVAQVRREMEPHALSWTRTVSDQLPWQHYIEFTKVAASTKSASAQPAQGGQIAPVGDAR